MSLEDDFNKYEVEKENVVEAGESANPLSREVKFGPLLKFAMPTIIMMIFMSMYTMVDGIFVSRLVGTDALSATNIVYPILNLVLAVSIMLATGGSAIIAKKMGEGNNKEAKENFTFIVCVGVVAGILISIVGLIFIDPLIRMLGANDVIYQYCYDYIFILFFFVPLSVLQMMFQYLFVTAGKPTIGLIVTIAGGLTNIILDYVFIAVMDMGISGAAVATGIGYCIPAIYGLFYFALNRKGMLYFIKPKFDGKVLLHSCINGSSEMVTELSVAVITFLLNIIMMKNLGQDGVAAITIVLYAEFLLTAIYLGYSSGVAPIVSYNYGNNDTSKLKKLFKISILFIGGTSILMYVAAIVSAKSIVQIFAPIGSAVFDITVHGFYLFSLAYLFMGINIFASSLFTALSNGKISALISFLRTFVFIVIGLLTLPSIFDINGVWLAVPFAEILAVCISILLMRKYRKVYHYA